MELVAGLNLHITASCSQGGRKYMEDTFTIAYVPLPNGAVDYAYIGMFDGHGGHEASAFARVHLLNSIISQEGFWTNDDVAVEKAIQKGFLDTHESMWRGVGNWRKTPSGHTSTAGTTATICFIKNEKLHIGHVGDSGVVLGYKDGGLKEWKGRPLTKDHKPDDPEELERIRNCGGKVQLKAGIYRVVWNRIRVNHPGPITRSAPPLEEIPFLAVARSLGDLWSFNKESDTYVVSPFPDVITIPLNRDVHKCLVFGTDGLWNVVSPDAAVTITQTCELNNSVAGVLQQAERNINEINWTNPAKKLVDVALQRWSDNQMRADNTTVITVTIEPEKKKRQTALTHHESMHIITVMTQQRNCSVEGSEVSSKLLYTSSKVLGPSSNAAAVKLEPVCSFAYEYSENLQEAVILEGSDLGIEDSASSTVADGNNVGSTHLTMKEKPPPELGCLAVPKANDIDVCCIDKSLVDSNDKEFSPSNYTAEVVINSSVECEQVMETTSPIDYGTGVDNRQLKYHHKSRKNNFKDRECPSSYPNKCKMKRIEGINDRKLCTSSLNHHKSRLSKHSGRKVGTSFTTEQKRKRSPSDDRTGFSSNATKKKNLNDISHDFQVNVSCLDGSSSHEKSDDSNSFKSSSASWHSQIEQSLGPASLDTMENRSQSYTEKMGTESVGQQDTVRPQLNINLSRAQKRSGAWESDNEQLQSSLSPQHKKSKSHLDDRKCTRSPLIQPSFSERESDGELATILSGDDYCDARSGGTSPVLNKMIRGQSYEKKLASPWMAQEKGKRSKSVPNHPSISSSSSDRTIPSAEQTFSIKNRDGNLYPSDQQSRAKSRSHDRKTKPITEQSTSLNHRDEKSYPSPSTPDQLDTSRSNSYDRKTVPAAEQTNSLNLRDEKSYFLSSTSGHQRMRRNKSNDTKTIHITEQISSSNHQDGKHSESSSAQGRKTRSISRDRETISPTEHIASLNHKDEKSSDSTSGQLRKTRSRSPVRKAKFFNERTDSSNHQDEKLYPLPSTSGLQSSTRSNSFEEKTILVTEQTSSSNCRNEESNFLFSTSGYHRTRRSESHDRKTILVTEQSASSNDRDRKYSDSAFDQRSRMRTNSRDRKTISLTEQRASLNHRDEKRSDSTSGQLRMTRSTSPDKKKTPVTERTGSSNHQDEKSYPLDSTSGLQRITRSNSRERKTVFLAEQTSSVNSRDEKSYFLSRFSDQESTRKSNSHGRNTRPVTEERASSNHRDRKCSDSSSGQQRKRSNSRERKTIPVTAEKPQNHQEEKCSNGTSGQLRTRSRSRDKETKPSTKQSASSNHQDEKSRPLASSSSHQKTTRSNFLDPVTKQTASSNHQHEKCSDSSPVPERKTRTNSPDRNRIHVTKKTDFLNNRDEMSRFLTRTSDQKSIMRSNACDRKSVSLAQERTFPNHRDRKLYPSASTSSQLRITSSNSHDRKTMPVVKVATSLNNRDEKLSASTSVQLRKTRSNSRDRKTIFAAEPTASLDHREEKSSASTSGQVRRARDRYTRPTDEQAPPLNHKKDQKSYTLASISYKQMGTRSKSRDRSTVLADRNHLKPMINEISHTSAPLNGHSIKRSHSYDESMYKQSDVIQNNRRSQSVAARTVDRSWSLPGDKQPVASFFTEHKPCPEHRDDRQSASLRRQSDTDMSQNEFKYEKHWSKRRKAPSTHTGQLSQNAAESRRKTCGSITFSSSRSTCSDTSVETFKSVGSWEKGRVLRSVTAAVIAESLPIAKKLRSSPSVVPIPVNYLLCNSASSRSSVL